ATGTLTPTCSRASGSTFPVGTTTVTCSATDAHGNTGSDSFTVSVTLDDTTPPVVTVPADFSVDTESSGGRTVTFSASANDNVDGPLPASCRPSSGSTFPVGTTKVTCTATDSHGNTGSADFDVTVNLVDHTAPVISVPASFSVNTPNPSGTTVTYSASANDNLDGPITPSCTPASGSTFPLGPTSVTCTATDSHGNSAQKGFTVTVNLVDTTPPVITVPASFSRNTPDPSGATVTYSASAHDNVDGAISPTCSPASGSKFPVGPNTVTCSATDAHGNTAQKSFTITVVLVDVTPPAFKNVPANTKREADTPNGSVVTYVAPTAVDNVDGPLPVTCSPLSGKVFALGLTKVHCTATDSHGNTASAVFEVDVLDTTPPRLVLPPNASVYATSPGGISVDDPVVQSFLNAAAATDLVDDHPSVTNDAPRSLPVGNDTITFVATDASGNSTRGTAVLTVKPQPPAGTPQLPPTVVDRTPPDEVSGVTVKVGNRLVRLRWKNPKAKDFAYVQ